MILKKIYLENFRNYQKNLFNFSPNLTLIFGENSRGKTNLLEAIYFLLKGSGFREDKEEELINFGKNYLIVEGEFKNDQNDKNVFLIKIEKKENLVEKKFYFNKVLKKQFFYLQESPGVVLFTPYQIELIVDSPGVRRKYFDDLISFFDFQYKKSLNNYEKALTRRNKILEKNLPKEKLIEEIDFWNHYLEKEGEYIVKKRQFYVDFLNKNYSLDSRIFFVEYLKNEFNKENLKKYFEKEQLVKKTLFGPQKDDFKFFIKKDNLKKDVRFFGSRSEQRLTVFWLKINELNFYKQAKKRPVLLLDDVFSELDEKNQQLIFSIIENYQTILTTTEKKFFNLIKKEKILINLN